MSDVARSEFGIAHEASRPTAESTPKPPSLRNRAGAKLEGFLRKLHGLEKPTPEQQADPNWLASEIEKFAPDAPFEDDDVLRGSFRFNKKDTNSREFQEASQNLKRSIGMLIADGALERDTFSRGKRQEIDGYRIVNTEALRRRAQPYEARRAENK